MGNIFTFREITGKDELEKFFRLRYDIYSNCRLRAVLKAKKNPIDIDYFDVHSKHYALTVGNKDAGYFRVVMPKDELIQGSVIEIAKKNKAFNDYDSYLSGEAAPYPFLSYKEVPAGYWDYFKNLQHKNKKLAEASRLILQPEFRTIRTSRFLIECAIVLYLIICFGKMQAVLSCNIKHKSFYEYYGFKAIGAENGFSSYGYDSVAMSLSVLPDQHHLKLEEMKNEFNSTGKIAMEI
jgi:hypothetical protein